MDMSKKFEVRPTDNGGLVIVGATGIAHLFETDSMFNAAFTTPADMIVWLAKEYGITVHAVAAGGTHISVSVNEDEEHHHRFRPKSPDGDDWIEWRGGERAPLTRGVPVYVRHRDGKEYPTKVFEGPASRWTWDHRDTDIVAYRPVPWKGLAFDPKFDAAGLAVPN